MSELKQIIVDDKSVPKELKTTFISYAELFDGDLRENLTHTSLDLDHKYATGDKKGWRKFLNHASVRNYINEYLKEMQDREADKLLLEEPKTTQSALKVKEHIEKTRPKMDNSHIVVWLMPQKEYIEVKDE